ncbi:MAG: hypothetical protein OWU84_09365 [Firmicutes bacterium]|nr:hypothetical protein [Bacillota bacterium]
MIPPVEDQQNATRIPVGYVTTSRYCEAGCAFCRLASPPPTKIKPSEPAAAVVPAWAEARLVKVRGGLFTAKPFDFWVRWLRQLTPRLAPGTTLLAFSPVELWHYHETEHRSLRDLARALVWAGVSALGPGGSETWDVARRAAWSTRRITVEQWWQVVESAAAVGLSYTVGPMILPRQSQSDADDYLRHLRPIPPLHLELKPLHSQGTRLQSEGSPQIVEVAEWAARVRTSRPTWPIYVRWPSPHSDAAAILGASGVSGILIPQWEVEV